MITESSASFSVQGSGVSAATLVTLTARYNGGAATTTLTVAPGDKASTSLASLDVLGSSSQLLGTMVSQGNGHYTFQTKLTADATTTVRIVSNLGAKTSRVSQSLRK